MTHRVAPSIVMETHVSVDPSRRPGTLPPWSVMRRIFGISMLCLAAGVVNACKPESEIITEDIPTAGVRFVNAVPDTGGMDFRPVDIVENTTFYNVAFKGTTCSITRMPAPGPALQSSAPRPRALQRPNRLPSPRRWSSICPPRFWRRKALHLHSVRSLPTRVDAGNAGHPDRG